VVTYDHCSRLYREWRGGHCSGKWMMEQKRGVVRQSQPSVEAPLSFVSMAVEIKEAYGLVVFFVCTASFLS
jgi:hypothetical protein